MAKKFVMVRVEAHVHLKLQAFREMLDRVNGDKGFDCLEATDRFGVSMSTAIEELLRREKNHTLRSEKSRLEARKKRLEVQDGSIPS